VTGGGERNTVPNEVDNRHSVVDRVPPLGSPIRRMVALGSYYRFDQPRNRWLRPLLLDPKLNYLIRAPLTIHTFV